MQRKRKDAGKTEATVVFSKQVGNFVVELIDAEYRHIEIRAIGGIWKVCYSDDNVMFGRLYVLAVNDEFEEYLKTYICALYSLSNNVPDWEFLSSYGEALQGMFERYEKMENASPSTEDEDAKIMDEMMTLEEMKEASSTSK